MRRLRARWPGQLSGGDWQFQDDGDEDLDNDDKFDDNDIEEGK